MSKFLPVLRTAFLISGITAIITLSGCSTERIMSGKIQRVIQESPILRQYQAGFALANLDGGRLIYGKDADKYFTPASNTKLYTFYAGLKMLSDSIPSLRYVEQGDSLIFWATGDPSMLQSQLRGTKAIEFLKSSNKKLFYSPGRYTGDFYANGWAWDDYNDYYQAEINELPLMGNLLSFKAPGGQLQTVPAALRDCVYTDSLALHTDSGPPSAPRPFRIIRDINSNHFRHPAAPAPVGFSQDVPFKQSLPLTLSLLTDTLNKAVGLLKMKMPANAKTIYNLKTDSVLKAMMLPSDNFIAEQLLLVYANQLGEELNAKKAISHIEKNYLSTLPDKPKWVDGSGLSRGNLFTPRDMISLLQLIYKEVDNPERLFDMLPAGGKTGTLRNAYPKTSVPFVFGKTGTLSGVHNQSGYVQTRKGKTYTFSFMNNNYVLPTADVRNEMVRIMTFIHEKF